MLCVCASSFGRFPVPAATFQAAFPTAMGPRAGFGQEGLGGCHGRGKQPKWGGGAKVWIEVLLVGQASC